MVTFAQLHLYSRHREFQKKPILPTPLLRLMIDVMYSWQLDTRLLISYNSRQPVLN